MPQTEFGYGFVNSSEIGGNSLTVVSAYKLNSSVGEDGTFTTNVSAEGPQLIFVMDDQQKIRALAISLPQHSNNIIIDSTSTAKASLFMVIGLGVQTTDPILAENHLNEVGQLSCFPHFQSFLKSKLLATTYTDLVNSPDYTTSITTCIKEIQEHQGLFTQ